MIAATFALALLVTYLVETPIAWAWTRSRRALYHSALCNALTNPAMNLLLWCAVRLWGATAYPWALAALEIAVLAVEARVWHLLTGMRARGAWGLSLVANAASFAAGLALGALWG